VSGRSRLDAALVARGLVASRARGRDLIKRGLVRVNGAVAAKAGAAVGADADITIIGEEAGHVSRAAAKLTAALDAFGFDPGGRVALDIGASTGGFTQVLLAHGARRVYAVDVGQAQLHASLAGDPRVINLERRDARDLTSAEVPAPVGAITVDVSFISLRLVLPHVLRFAAPDAWLVALVKPQFEAGRAHVGKSGIVTDARVRDEAVESIRGLLAGQGWRPLAPIPSPLRGQGGNQEYLIGARHG